MTAAKLQPYTFEHAGREHVFYATSRKGAKEMFELWTRRPSVTGQLTGEPITTKVRAPDNNGRGDAPLEASPGRDTEVTRADRG